MAKLHRNHFLERDSGDITDSCEPVALVILNSPSVVKCKDLLNIVWGHSDVRICADGGANKLYEMYAGDNANEFSTDVAYLPNLIKGDLDSLHPEIGEYYKSKGVSVVKKDDQDTNDLDKCMESVIEYFLDEAKVISSFGFLYIYDRLIPLFIPYTLFFIHIV